MEHVQCILLSFSEVLTYTNINDNIFTVICNIEIWFPHCSAGSGQCDHDDRWPLTMWGHTVFCSNGTQASRAGHTLILTTLVIFVTTGTSLNQACGYNQICSCQIQNSSESVIFTGIQTHCSARTWIGDTNHTPGLYPPHAALQQQFRTSIPIIAT